MTVPDFSDMLCCSQQEKGILASCVVPKAHQIKQVLCFKEAQILRMLGPEAVFLEKLEAEDTEAFSEQCLGGALVQPREGSQGHPVQPPSTWAVRSP